MALDELGLMRELGGVASDIKSIKESQASQGARLGSLEAAIDKKTDDLYIYINQATQTLHSRINDHIESKRGGNGNGKPQSTYRAVLAHPATQVGGAGTAGAIILWILQHIKFQ
jgi:hypothetical protein